MEMRKPKTLRSRFPLSLVGVIVTGLFLWVVSHAGIVDSFVVDDPLQIVGKCDSDDFQDIPTLCRVDTETGKTDEASFKALSHGPSCPAPGSFLAQGIFRLRLVRVNPSIGPPHTSFPPQATG